MADLPTDSFMPSDDAESAFVAPQRPRWSLVAIAGFMLSFLLALAPVGVVLGIVGIFHTRDGRRRGMGLAIAAIPVGLIVSFLTGIGILAVVMFSRITAVSAQVTSCFRTTQSEVPQRAAELYGRCSKRFRLAVADDAFQAWAMGVAEKHGSLQGTKPAKQPIDSGKDGTSVFHVTGQFVNGPADIAITLGWPGLTPEIDDVAVDGVSPKSARRPGGGPD